MTSKHKTKPIPHTFREWSIARRKGNRVRYQDAVTAKMTGWCASPEYIAERRQKGQDLRASDARARQARLAAKRAGKTAALQQEARDYWRWAGRAGLRVDRLTVAELQLQLRTAGIGYTSRMRKSELVAALLGTELTR